MEKQFPTMTERVEQVNADIAQKAAAKPKPVYCVREELLIPKDFHNWLKEQAQHAKVPVTEVLRQLISAGYHTMLAAALQEADKKEQGNG